MEPQSASVAREHSAGKRRAEPSSRSCNFVAEEMLDTHERSRRRARLSSVHAIVAEAALAGGRAVPSPFAARHGSCLAQAPPMRWHGRSIAARAANRLAITTKAGRAGNRRAAICAAQPISAAEVHLTCPRFVASVAGSCRRAKISDSEGPIPARSPPGACLFRLLRLACLRRGCSGSFARCGVELRFGHAQNQTLVVLSKARDWN